MIKKIVPIAAGLAMALSIGNATAADDSEYRVVDKPLDLTIHMHFRNKYAWDENWPVAKEYERLTGIKLIGTASSVSTNSLESFNLMLVSGDLPDVVGGDSLKDLFFKYGMEGAFIPLNDLIDEHAPNLKAFFEEHPRVAQAITAPDGKIYHIPYVPDGVTGRAYFIRQDWLDKLGLEQPKTVDELYDVLVAFRDQDPNGNGIKDEVPAFFRHWQEFIRLVTLFDARSTGSEKYHQYYIDESGTVHHPYAEEAYRDAMVQLIKWYNEGLIDKEVFTRGSKGREYLLGNNLGGFTHDWFSSTAGYNTSLRDRIEGFDLVPFLPPASPSGRVLEEHGRAMIKPDGWAITYANKHPVETIKYMDFVFSDKGRNISNFGVEGETWTMVDGKPQFTDEVLSLKDGPVNSQMWSIGAQIPIGFHMDYAYEDQWTNEIAREGIAKYVACDCIAEQFPGVAMTVAEQKVWDKYYTNLETYMLEQQQRWVLGSADIEAEWDNYVARLDKLGLKKVLAAVQTAYDRQFK